MQLSKEIFEKKWGNWKTGETGESGKLKKLGNGRNLGTLWERVVAVVLRSMWASSMA